MGQYNWYFEFRVTDPVSGYEKKDYSVASACDQYFPITSILSWKDEEFGEEAKLFIEMVLPISAAQYNELLSRIGVDGNADKTDIRRNCNDD